MKIDSCPLDGNFDQEVWVSRMLRWENFGPGQPHAFECAADAVLEVQVLLRADDAQRAAAAAAAAPKRGKR